MRRKTVYLGDLFGWRIHIYKRYRIQKGTKEADRDSDLQQRIDFEPPIPLDDGKVSE